MKKYIVRLRNYKGLVIDGEIYKASSATDAIEMYLERCERLGICKCLFDYYTVDEVDEI